MTFAIFLTFIKVIGILVVISFFTDYITVNLISGKWRLRWIAYCLGFITTILTVFFFQNNTFILPVESSLVSELYESKDLITNGGQEKAKQFPDSNFIFINTSEDPVIYPIEKTGHPGMAIVDRRKLLKLLSFLDNHYDEIDLIACDVAFPNSLPEDTALIKIFNLLSRDNKLVIAYSPVYNEFNNFLYGNMRQDFYGSVDMAKNEKIYFSNELFPRDGNIPSFAYQMYSHLSKSMAVNKSLGNYISTETDSTGRTYYCFERYISDFQFTDENALFKPAAPAKNSLPTSAPRFDGGEGPRNYFNLGYAAEEDGQQEIIDLIKSKTKRNKNIVFIGAMNSEFDDTHITAFGRMHGAAIILNEFYHFSEKLHAMSLFKLLLYLLSLWLGFSYVIRYILKEVFEEPKAETVFFKKKYAIIKQKLPKAIKQIFRIRVVNFFIEYLSALLRFITDEFHYILLFILGLVINLLFSKVINVAGIALMLLLFEGLLKFFRKRALSPLSP